LFGQKWSKPIDKTDKQSGRILIHSSMKNDNPSETDSSGQTSVKLGAIFSNLPPLDVESRRAFAHLYPLFAYR